MLIKKSLPYDFCENCGEFVLKVDDQRMFSPDIGCTERVITVYCRNSGKCKHLKKNLEKQMRKDGDLNA